MKRTPSLFPKLLSRSSQPVGPGRQALAKHMSLPTYQAIWVLRNKALSPARAHNCDLRDIQGSVVWMNRRIRLEIGSRSGPRSMQLGRLPSSCQTSRRKVGSRLPRSASIKSSQGPVRRHDLELRSQSPPPLRPHRKHRPR